MADASGEHVRSPLQPAPIPALARRCDARPGAWPCDRRRAERDALASTPAIDPARLEPGRIALDAIVNRRVGDTRTPPPTRAYPTG